MATLAPTSVTPTSVAFELRIDKSQDGTYTVATAVQLPGDEGESRQTQPRQLRLDPAQLSQMTRDAEKGGYTLRELIFAQGEVAESFLSAASAARANEATLRVLLRIAPDAPELQNLAWEQLLGPDEAGPLALRERTLFSRVVTGETWRPVEAHARSELRALLCIAAPHDNEPYQLESIDERAVEKRIRTSLSDIHVATPEPSGAATLDRVLDALRDGYDMLYFVANGLFRDGKAWLNLANGEGVATLLAVDELRARLAELRQPPRLVLLEIGSVNPDAARTKRAPDDDEAAGRALNTELALQLCASGSAACITLPSSLSPTSNERFIGTLTHELQADGQIDRAVAVARRQIEYSPDWWMPVLFTRLASGQLWEAGDPGERRPPPEFAAAAYTEYPPPPRSAQESFTQAAQVAQQLPLESAAPFEQASQPQEPRPADAVPASRASGAAPQPSEAELAEVAPNAPAAAAQPTAAEPVAPDRTEPPAQPAAANVVPGAQPTTSTAPAAANAVPGAQPATSTAPAAAPSIRVLVQALEARYEPPATTLAIEIRADLVQFRHDNTDYASPHKLEAAAAELRASLATDPREHGQLLFDALFNDEPWDGALPTRIGYEAARAQAGAELRIELNLRHRPFEQWRWEYLQDRGRQRELPLATAERSPLFRRPTVGVTTHHRAVAARPLAICAAICSPPELGEPGNALLQPLARLDLARQEEILRDALEPLVAAELATCTILGGPAEPPATLETIGAALDAGCQVLHLLAHGVAIGGQFHLVIAHKRTGNTAPLISADEFSDLLLQRGKELRLVILAACNSAQLTGPLAAASSLGAALVEHGVPAVIGMQDLVAVNTVQFFTQHFYADLARSGRVDMAVAATRFDLFHWLRGAPDWGIPVLYMGPHDGHLFELDLARAATKLPPRAPVIKSYNEPRVDQAELGRQVAAIMAGQGNGALQPAQIESLRRALMPAESPERALFATGQRRELLSQLRRPLMIDADELQAYVEEQPDSLVLAPEVYRQVAAALSIGKHVILIGPPGTGKTTVAHHICAFAAARGFTAEAMTTTASADWTTFDTVGGYVPNASGALQFRPGIFLRAIGAGQWLVIDEINRAEIDKAFGELFTVLSGQPVALPYWVGEHQVRVLPGLRERDPARPWIPATVGSPYDYVAHPNWRIIGAMNVYDKSSLFAMSFAFMRRFAFVELDVPPVTAYREQLLAQWLKGGALPPAAHPALIELICTLLETRTLMSRRALGPAIIKDLVQHLAHGSAARRADGLSEQVAEAFMLYAVPQLDSLDQETIVAIHAELATIFGAGARLLNRIQLLYPHIRAEEWTP